MAPASSRAVVVGQSRTETPWRTGLVTAMGPQGAWPGETGQCSEPDGGVTGLGSELYTQPDRVDLHSRQTLKSKFSNIKDTTGPKGHIS